MLHITILEDSKLRELVEYPLDSNYAALLIETLCEWGRYGNIARSLDVFNCTLLDIHGFTSSLRQCDLRFLFGGLVSKLPFIPAAGKGFDYTKAMLSGIGEYFERVIPILSRTYIMERIYFATSADLRKYGKNVLGPDKLYLFHERQYADPRFPFVPFRENLKIGWVEARHLNSGENVFVPAQLIFGYFRMEREPPICYPTTDGLSAASTREEAILHGLLEFIERDANNIRWVAKIPPLKLKLDWEELLSLVGLPVEKSKLRILMENYRLDTYLWPTELEGIPTITIHVINKRATWYKYYPGMGSDCTIIDALRKALAEVIQAMMFISYMELVRKAFGRHSTFYYVTEDEDPNNIDNLFKTVVYYGYEKNLRQIYEEYFSKAHLITLKDATNIYGYSLEELNSVSKKLDICLKVLREHNIDPIVIDLTPPYVTNVRIVKVFICELTQYYISRYPYFGHPRFYYAPRILNKSDRLLTFDELNKMPLPYP